jgi:hypothetical protein
MKSRQVGKLRTVAITSFFISSEYWNLQFIIKYHWNEYKHLLFIQYILS